MSIHIVREPEIGLSERIGDLENYYKEQILSKELKEIYNEKVTSLACRITDIS